MNRTTGLAFLLALGCAGPWASAQANSIVVNSTADTGSACTLRNAIDNANSNTQTHSGCAAGSGADTITFDPGVFASPQTITVGSTLPGLTDPATTTIDGGNLVTVSGGDAVQVFWVGDLSTGAGSAVFRDIEITHGNGDGYGGGMFMTGTTLELDHVTFSNSTASFGGGGFFTQGGTTTINDCVFAQNTMSSGTGGGLSNSGAVVVVRDSTFTGNTASSGGGGIFTGYGGSVTVTNSTFSGNSVGYYGSAIRNFKGTAMTLDYVTIAGNSTTYFSGGALDVEQDATISISNSIVAGNTYGDCRRASTPGSGMTDAGNNFFGDTTCNGVASGDPMLGPLSYTGGLTPTMVPVAASPVIDTANCEAAVATGQRGVARPQGAGCDIGAVEVEASIFADGFELPGG
ncbi:MAG TPA: choice-of-anchor Q domain-containing protein [Rhodanobacteraceae bacterium]|nr:choice-of-anchor Q domain-containing protein [Rhodanobacteraceae bacterium]